MSAVEFLGTLPGQVFVAAFITVNVVSFFVMGRDKRQAAREHRSERIPEGTLFFLAAAFGAIGVYIGMQIFRHKTRHWYFQTGIPLLFVQNVATLILAAELFR